MSIIDALKSPFTTTAGTLFFQLATAVIILVLGIIFGKILGKLVGRLVNHLKVSSTLNDAGIKIKVDILANRIVQYLIYTLAFIIAMGQLGFSVFILNVLYVGIVIVIILAILLAIKDFVPNLTAGFHIQSKEYYKDGDVIKVDGVEGRVLDVDLTETKVQAKDGNIVIIPNSYILKQKVVVKEKSKVLQKKLEF